MSQEQFPNPFIEPSKIPKHKVSEVFRSKKDNNGKNEIDKALKEAQAVAESRSEKRRRIEELFDTGISDQAYECIQSLIKIGYNDGELLDSIDIEDKEIKNLWLDSLTSAEHLTLPGSVGGYLDLRGLTSAEHLTLPKSIGGSLWLDGLISAEKDKLRKKYPQHAEKIQ